MVTGGARAGGGAGMARSLLGEAAGAFALTLVLSGTQVLAARTGGAAGPGADPAALPRGAGPALVFEAVLAWLLVAVALATARAHPVRRSPVRAPAGCRSRYGQSSVLLAASVT